MTAVKCYKTLLRGQFEFEFSGKWQDKPAFDELPADHSEANV